MSANDCLVAVSWDLLFDNDDIDLCLARFYDVVYSVIERFVPVKHFKSTDFPIWFSAELRKLVVLKKAAHKSYKLNESQESYTKFSMLRERCKQLQRDCYKSYLDSIQNRLAADPKHFWRHINNLKRSGSYPQCMFLDSSRDDSGNDIVNLFARHFASTYVKADPDVPEYNFSRTINCDTISISVIQVFEGICKLKTSNSVGPDGIPSIFLKECVFALSKPLHYLFNCSLKNGIFPSFWKMSFLVPIFKSGNRENVADYRGISIQSQIPKLFDNLISGQLSWCCKNIIIDQQHGFVQGRSTVSNLLLYQDHLLGAFENGLQVDSIYTDFSKAFDRVCHKLLLSKLAALGFGDNVVRWLGSFLEDRGQQVRIGSYISGIVEVHSGVPQGSHCGPLLFNLFINDIGDAIDSSSFLLFADDLKIFKTIKSKSDQILLQRDIDSLYKWSVANCLNLNVNKCFCVSFGRSRNINHNGYTLNDAPLTRKDVARDLGVLFDVQLTFAKHILELTRKGLKNLGFINKNSIGFKPESFKILYCSLVCSGLEYASIIWTPYYQYLIDNIESVQKRFLHSLAFRSGINIYNNYHIDYSAVIDAYHLETLLKRRNCADLCFLYKLLNGDICSPEILSKLNFNIVHRARNSNYFAVPYHSTSYGYYCPLTRICRSLNISGLDPFCGTFSRFRNSVHQLL